MYPYSIEDILWKLFDMKGSDLHIMEGLKPMFRISGDMLPFEEAPILSKSDIELFVRDILDEEQLEGFKKNSDLDFSYQILSGPRYRGNALMNSGSIGLVFRVFPMFIPQFDSLGLPTSIKNLINLPRGLVLVTGTTGSGKSTTLAALINLINETLNKNVVTIEDPVEFIHKSKNSFIRQREIGKDTKSYSNALRAVLRQDPDVVLIGEMRDPESISIALTAAETGHLVFSTLHTQSAPQTISRIVDAFESGQKNQVRQQLASTLKAVISQQLLRLKDGKGRVAAIEYMCAIPAIGNLIREAKEHQLYSVIQTNANLGMQTMDMALARLILQEKITMEHAMDHCIDKATLVSLVSGDNLEFRKTNYSATATSSTGSSFLL